MNMKKIGLLLSGLFLGLLVNAQNAPSFSGKDPLTNEAEISLSLSKTKDICVGDVITLNFKGKVNIEGWHLYSAREDGEISYNATMLDIFADESKGAKKKGKMTENKKADEFEDELLGGLIRQFHEKEVIFSQKIEITSKDVNLVAELSAQTCTSEGMCKFLKLPFEWTFTAKDCGLGAVEAPQNNTTAPVETASNPVEGAMDLAGPMMAVERVGGKVVKGLMEEAIPVKAVRMLSVSNRWLMEIQNDLPSSRWLRAVSASPTGI